MSKKKRKKKARITNRQAKIRQKNKKPNRDRTNKGEKVFQMKGTFQEVWKEYLKLNEQLKNN